MGHQLVSFIDDNEGLAKNHKLRITCPRCKQATKDTSQFCHKPCIPKEFPKNKTWYQLRATQPETMAKLVAAWHWGKKEVLAIDKVATNFSVAPLNAKPSHRSKKLVGFMIFVKKVWNPTQGPDDVTFVLSRSSEWFR